MPTHPIILNLHEQLDLFKKKKHTKKQNSLFLWQRMKWEEILKHLQEYLNEMATRKDVEAFPGFLIH